MKNVRIVVLALVVLLIASGPVLASDKGAAAFYGNAMGAGIGAALTLVGAGIGFGRIGAAALESMARQPETAGEIRTTMLIIAALLEGATFFSLIVCILMALNSAAMVGG